MNVRWVVPALFALSALVSAGVARAEDFDEDDDAPEVAMADSPMLGARPVQPPAPAASGKDARGGELGVLRRTLASALIVKRLNLTADQKRELTSIIADAKSLRERAKSEMASAANESERKTLLEKAIADARSTGKVSAQTKVAMQEMREKVQSKGAGLKQDRRAIGKRLHALLTPDQIESLKEMHPRQAKQQGKQGGRALFRLMMTDEFAAELAR